MKILSPIRLLLISLLSVSMTAACVKRTPPPSLPTPSPTAVPTTLSLPVSRLLGLQLSGMPIEQVAKQALDPTALEAADLEKTFSISDRPYLEDVLKLVEAQLQSGAPLRRISVYFGGAPKNSAKTCQKDAGQDICLIVPYAFNCAEALSQRNWTEENYGKLCERLGRLKAYRPQLLVAVFFSSRALGAEEMAAPLPPPIPDKKKSSAAAAKTPSTAETQVSPPQNFPEIEDLANYLDHQGLIVGKFFGPENKLQATLKLLRDKVIAANDKALRGLEEKINFDDLRLVLLVSDDFGAPQEPGVPAARDFLETRSTVPGGTDFIFIHPYTLEADQKISDTRGALENFQALAVEQRNLHPTRAGIFLEQPAVTVLRSPEGKGGFLKQSPIVTPESMPASPSAESLPTAETKPQPSPPPGTLGESLPSPSPGLKPPALPQIPPAPPDPRSDAL
ncbi:MAG TPA: hypothetical protein DF383_10285 [Deltaproteobacteria bacterium]|nr:hypothetical protein [Deltaproteobacteria bacterium]